MKPLFKSYYFIFIVGLLTLLGGVFVVFTLPVRYRSALIYNPLVRHVVPLYRSLRKIPDIVFAPYFFMETKLPVYRLTIPPKNLVILNSRLPSEPFAGLLLDENRVEVNAVFAAENFGAEAKVRYRGLRDNHWNAKQKSFNVSFSRESPFRGMKGLDLVIPYDRQYVVELLQMYRAKKFGIPVPDMWFSRLNLNGQDAGVYLSWEHWSDQWLSRMGFASATTIFADDDGRPGVYKEGNPPLLSREGLSRWKSYTRVGNAFSELQALVAVLNETDDETFGKLIPHLIDLDAFYGWSILRILSGSGHQTETTNLILLFDTARGKFTFIPFDLNMGDRRNAPPYDDADLLLVKRLFSLPRFRSERNKLLQEYLTEENLADDLAFYDNMVREVKPEFLSDSNKLYNNFQFLSQIRTYRALIEDNFHRGVAFLEKEYTVSDAEKSTFESKLNLPEEFSRLPEVASSREEFLAHNPYFYGLDGPSLAIGPGEYVLHKTVIIPSDTRLVVQPGTTMRMGKGVSIISYSPVEIRGTPASRVQISASDLARPWGSLLIVNAGSQKSSIGYADISGGSGVRINGIVATGMVAAHGSDLEVSDSTFSGSFDDDALNVKYAEAIVRNSIFLNTHSDAIDLDNVSDGSRVSNNTFLSPIGTGSEEGGGDAVDVSFSQVVIEANRIQGCGDKGISVGEASRPLIQDNTIQGCAIGVAVKDSSRARIFNNHFIGNDVAVSAYQKKEEFGGGVGIVIGSQFENNRENAVHDSVSDIIFLNHD
ncbi:MAG: hypothetical protein A3C07_02870 [Candidatus Sungbacteria bacterium RIFCSPHIGHO2_02_FULL_47_11]|uniref:Periplasmic copper-binding protein NosD beta helix domain-containing protein n=1 Tax=Candidatus Sungbacteria bacterium RIFCSPHIGHO2_02_FULL_47_11 TaxID=1802270 RepID=A0A1G2KNE8_9BACT|nr:MAG: hypothetical protein A3C07_02870 [Candidatus Sungbacteria bacterium RIFCSPHIGHO2_02_FULL_47_11]